MFFTCPYIFFILRTVSSITCRLRSQEMGIHTGCHFILPTITRIFKLSAAIRRWLPHCHSHMMLYVFNLKLVVSRVSFPTITTRLLLLTDVICVTLFLVTDSLPRGSSVGRRPSLLSCPGRCVQTILSLKQTNNNKKVHFN